MGGVYTLVLAVKTKTRKQIQFTDGYQQMPYFGNETRGSSPCLGGGIPRPECNHGGRTIYTKKHQQNNISGWLSGKDANTWFPQLQKIAVVPPAQEAATPRPVGKGPRSNQETIKHTHKERYNCQHFQSTTFWGEMRQLLGPFSEVLEVVLCPL